MKVLMQEKGEILGLRFFILSNHVLVYFSKVFPFLVFSFICVYRFSKSSTFCFVASTAVSVCPLMVVWGRQDQRRKLHMWWSFLNWGLPVIAKSHAFWFSFHHFFRVQDVFAEYKPLHIPGCCMLGSSTSHYHLPAFCNYVTCNFCFGMH